jgi:pimeloyl-ACP methyl ester carboxylesterase
VKGDERTLSLATPAGTIKYIAVGRTSGARLVVIYLHGMNGTRYQGADDWMFGGNFNRVKNLMVRNGGLYLSPDFSDFTDRGKAQITALMEAVGAQNPGAPIFVACGSYGGVLCWNLAEDPQSARLLGGLLFMGSINDPAFFPIAARWDKASRLPIYIGHGTDDNVFAWRDQDAFFRRLKAAAPDYPIRLVLFETGSHGTPIRMTDWRQILNWMLAAPGR